jgi:hypothetical protein
MQSKAVLHGEQHGRQLLRIDGGAEVTGELGPRHDVDDEPATGVQELRQFRAALRSARCVEDELQVQQRRTAQGVLVAAIDRPQRGHEAVRIPVPSQQL